MIGTRMSDAGALAEIEFERRLVERGYRQIMRPARADTGVDYVVLTAGGWVGVQVKSASTIRVMWGRKAYPHSRVDLKRHDRGRDEIAHYEACGVSVVAAWHAGAFYLIPLAACHDNAGRRFLSLTRYGWTREAWAEVLGTPPGEDVRREATRLEAQLALPTSGPPAQPDGH